MKLSSEYEEGIRERHDRLMTEKNRKEMASLNQYSILKEYLKNNFIRNKKIIDKMINNRLKWEKKIMRLSPF
jgi:hypothetical protein